MFSSTHSKLLPIAVLVLITSFSWWQVQVQSFVVLAAVDKNRIHNKANHHLSPSLRLPRNNRRGIGNGNGNAKLYRSPITQCEDKEVSEDEGYDYYCHTTNEANDDDDVNDDVNQLVLRHRGGGTVAKSQNKNQNPFVRLYYWYNDCLVEKPILTKSATAAIVNVLGDVLAQYLEAPSAAGFVLNPARLQVFFLCGLLYVGPYMHWWYEQLVKVGNWIAEKRIGTTHSNNISNKQVQTMGQLLVDQTIGSIVSLCLYFYVYEFMDAFVHLRLPMIAAATANISNNIRSVLLTNYCIWPAVNWISFSYVPVQFRVLLNNVVGVLWNAFLCTQVAGGG